MTLEKFNEIVDERIAKIESSLVSKGQEYSRGDDRLWNFKRGAEISGKHPVRTLEGYVTKHITSFYDMIADLEKGKRVPAHVIDEKIGDIINYMICAEALFLEMEENEEV